MNEDWLFTLCIQRMLDTDGSVIYDIGVGRDDPEVETRIEEVGFEYLDPSRGSHRRRLRREEEGLVAGRNRPVLSAERCSTTPEARAIIGP